MFGFLNVYKPKNMTSHDVVACLRHVTGVKQIGHTGTLDPFAEGVLPICIGKATRLIEYLSDDKAYVGTIQLGSSTTTYDSEGDIINTSDSDVAKSEILSLLPKYMGCIEQTPPIYSAIKVRGKKLYEYARKGETVEIKPRTVNINRLDLLNYNQATREVEIYIDCSKGTYIRSLANDIGEDLGIYGHLNKLLRVKAGDFKIENSIKLEKLKTQEDVINNLINPLEYLHYPKISIGAGEHKLISNGCSIILNQADGTIILTESNTLIAMGNVKNNVFYPQKVFI